MLTKITCMRALSASETQLVGGGPAFVIPPLVIAFGKGFAGGAGVAGLAIEALDAVGIELNK